MNARQRLARVLRMIEMALDAIPETDPARPALEVSRREAEAALYGPNGETVIVRIGEILAARPAAPPPRSRPRLVKVDE